MTEAQATIRAKAQKFEQMLVQTALDSPANDPPWIHSDVYLDINEDRVNAVVSAGGGSVLTFCTFTADYFEDIDGEAEAVIDVDHTLERLSVASDGGRMEFEFRGPEGNRLAQTLQARGALEMGVALPASEKVFDSVPEDLPDRWDEDNCFLSPSGNPHQTYVDTTVEQVGKIVGAVELDDSIDYFPISVTDGEFVLNVGEGDEYLRGDLSASEVDGADLTNWYGPGFEAVFKKTLSGDVQLQTTPGENGGHPMAVVQSDDEKDIRHVLVEVNPA